MFQIKSQELELWIYLLKYCKKLTISLQYYLVIYVIKERGSVFRYSDLEVGEEISILDDIKGVIASISNEKRLTSALGEEEKEDN